MTRKQILERFEGHAVVDGQLENHLQIDEVAMVIMDH